MKILIQAFKSFSKNEQLIFIVAFLIFVFSFIFIAINFLNEKSVFAPAEGGKIIEGVIGQPSFINPVIVGDNNPDRDLIELIFSDFSDLSENYKISEDGKIWNIRLKENIFWHDAKSITSDDVIFTIKTIQNSDSNSFLYSNWREIQAERISEREIKLTLPEFYSFFKNTIDKLKPIPKHLFENIPAANLKLSDYNLEPIGEGPFKFVSFKKERSGFISQVSLGKNENYFDKKPYLDEIIFKYYQNEEELIKAYNSGAIDNFAGIQEKNLFKININHSIFELRLPRYYAIFFNLANPILKDKEIRLALNYAVDKKALIEKIFNNHALLVNGPLVLGMEGYAPDIYSEDFFSIEKANQILENKGWQLKENEIRDKEEKKESKKLEFNLIVPEIAFLIETAGLIQKNWLKIGVKLNLIIKPLDEINEEFIKTRNYEIILFGNIFSDINSPDFSSFWHSSERFYPGLNLAFYENKTADSLIETTRKSLNENVRERALSSLQSLIIQDSPAVFLYSPNYFYIVKPALKGFEEKFISSFSARFKNVNKWHVKETMAFR